MVEVSIVNVVATADLNQEIDLCELQKLKEVFYDSDVYGGRAAYFKSPLMDGKVSIFNSGKMISTGTKSEREAAHELEYVKGFLVRRGFVKQVLLEHKISNIVVLANLEKHVDLLKLAEELRIVYEPEQFPGAILRLREPFKVTILLFASGKAILTGLKSSNQIEGVIRELSGLIEAYTN